MLHGAFPTVDFSFKDDLRMGQRPAGLLPAVTASRPTPGHLRVVWWWCVWCGVVRCAYLCTLPGRCSNAVSMCFTNRMHNYPTAAAFL